MIKVGDKIAGVEILWVDHLLTPAGQRRQYVRFTCACGQLTQTMHTVALKARAGRAYLRCVMCQDAGNYAQTKKPGAKKSEAELPTPKLEPVSRTGGKVAALTLAALNGLSPQARVIADAIIRRHIQACLRLGVPVENLDRVVIEAVEEAKTEARHTPTVTASVSRSEPFRRYDQYSSPREM